MPALTDEEWAIAYAVFVLAKTAPVLAGCQLLENGHHYLSSNTSATQAVEQPTLVKDLVWHKAPHPVRAGVLAAFAVDKNVKARMVAAGMGSAGVRLPYVESVVKATKIPLEKRRRHTIPRPFQPPTPRTLVDCCVVDFVDRAD